MGGADRLDRGHRCARLAVLLLYLGGVFWTIGYDTIYAHQDKEDDVRIGVKSSAIALGPHTRPWLFVFYGAALVLWAAAGHLAGLGAMFWVGLAAAASSWHGRLRG